MDFSSLILSLSEQWQVLIDLFSFVNMRRIKNSQLLSGSGSDDVLRNDIVLARQCHIKDILGGLLASQCHIKEILGRAQECHGVADEAGEEVLLAAGDLCGVAVRLGHPWRRLNQVVLEWGDVQSRSICAI